MLAGNTFINIRNKEHMTLGSPSVQAIYLDDQWSGTVMTNNSCSQSQTCYFVGGGRDNILSDNRCGEGVDTCVHIDNRGMGWQASDCTYNSSYTGELVAGLFAVNYTRPPYSTAFPSMVDTLTARPCVPVNISITRNLYCGGATKFCDATNASLAAWGDAISRNGVGGEC